MDCTGFNNSDDVGQSALLPVLLLESENASSRISSYSRLCSMTKAIVATVYRAGVLPYGGLALLSRM